MSQHSSSWNCEAVARLELELDLRRREYDDAQDYPVRRATLARCVAALEAMIPVYRQMAQLMKSIEAAKETLPR